ncbi:MAG: hypothetical protein RIS47_421, partial [Bacteroidota bacterium]
MQLALRIEAFAALGSVFRHFGKNLIAETLVTELHDAAIQAEIYNPWFTYRFTQQALANLGNELRTDKLHQWVSHHNFHHTPNKPKRVGLILAGNIPAVGFHDILSVLISGNIAVIKTSSKDNILITTILRILLNIEPRFSHFIEISERIGQINAIIATGSDNSARYFEQYFGKYPNIIRKNRFSVGILCGDESPEELKNLAHDIFDYYGLGCRNVSKLYIPQGFDLSHVFQAMEEFRFLSDHNKYRNNFDYQQALYLLNMFPHHTNDFVLLRENPQDHSPIGVL